MFKGKTSIILRKLQELSRRLSVEHGKTLRTLRRKPIIFEIEEFKVRRLRVGSYRLFYIIDHKRKYIIFSTLNPVEKLAGKSNCKNLLILANVSA